ncbi:FUSC family protein [Stakelama saccharophila]|uniref:FUSC family protein n=1 Tax=Stakelama saccharophila TaxID=3075605 RepID=A0ABZ0B668_9SPHN|nr:FUSC family protein [Stakelama sp. W311]WNO52692.1 FUSC family protein [Stakelama sp. W311]
MRAARDPLRIGSQAAVAAVVTFLVVRACGLEYASWGVISALFVTQEDADATLRTGLVRIAVTILGTLAGLVSVYLLGGSDNVIWRIGAVVFILYAVAERFPAFGFGTMAGVIVALDADATVLDGALERAIAITVGTVAGVVATLVIWPESAGTRALRSARGLLSSGADLVRAEFDILLGRRNRRDLDADHDRFLDDIGRVRVLGRSAHLKHGSAEQARQMADAMYRIWHSLVIIDRLCEQPNVGTLVRQDRGLCVSLARVGKAGEAFLDAAASGRGDDGHMAKLEAAIDTTRKRVPADAAGELLSLAFGLEEFKRTSRRLSELLAAAGR